MTQSSREIYWSAIVADFRRSGLATRERADDDRPEQDCGQHEHPDPPPQDVVIGQQVLPMAYP